MTPEAFLRKKKENLISGDAAIQQGKADLGQGFLWTERNSLVADTSTLASSVASRQIKRTQVPFIRNNCNIQN